MASTRGLVRYRSQQRSPPVHGNLTGSHTGLQDLADAAAFAVFAEKLSPLPHAGWGDRQPQFRRGATPPARPPPTPPKPSARNHIACRTRTIEKEIADRLSHRSYREPKAGDQNADCLRHMLGILAIVQPHRLFLGSSVGTFVACGGITMAVTDPVGTSVALTHFAGRAGDHNDRAMVGSRFVSASLAARFAVEPAVIGSPRRALSVGWEEELASALPELREMSRRYQRLFDEGVVPVTALSRCAVALVTLPVVAAHRPDAVVVVRCARRPEHTGDHDNRVPRWFGVQWPDGLVGFRPGCWPARPQRCPGRRARRRRRRGTAHRRQSGVVGQGRPQPIGGVASGGGGPSGLCAHRL